MNDFCKDCQHRNVPQSLKEKFDKVKPFFGDCPHYDKKVVYCFTKHFEVDWVFFIRLLLVKGGLSIKEIEEIEKIGKEEVSRRRGL